MPRCSSARVASSSLLHLARHLLHALHQLGEALVGFVEQRLGVADALLVDRAHRFGGAAALLLGEFARALVLLADRAAAFGARFRHHAGDFARAGGGGFQRLVEQAGEALEPLVEILGADVERGHQRIELHAALVDRGAGALVAGVDQVDGLGEFAAVAVELRRPIGRDR